MIERSAQRPVIHVYVIFFKITECHRKIVPRVNKSRIILAVRFVLANLVVADGRHACMHAGGLLDFSLARGVRRIIFLPNERELVVPTMLFLQLARYCNRVLLILFFFFFFFNPADRQGIT